MPAEERHTVLEVAKVQFDVQQTLPAIPGSHCSAVTPFPGASTVPLPQNDVKVTCTKWPSVSAVRLGLPG